MSKKYKTQRHVADICRVGDLTVKGTVYARTSSGYDDIGHIDEPFALLLGLVLGDGCYTGGVTNNGVGWSAYDVTAISDTADYFHSLGLVAVPQTVVGEYRITSLCGGKFPKGPVLTGIRNPLRRKLIDLKMWGRYSHEKTIPEDVHTWNNRSVAALLSGLVTSDGSVCPVDREEGPYTIQFSSTSRKMMEQVRYLLETRFGVVASTVSEYSKPKKEGGLYRPQHTIAINAWEHFQKLATILKLPGVKGPILTRCADNWKRGKKTRYGDRARLVSREYIGELKTYDIEVDHPDHLFILENGLIVSNSEPATQSIISSKHSGGVAGAMKSQQGFPVLDKMVSIPSEYNGAIHAHKDGVISTIREAPQGGQYVSIGGVEHYIPPDAELKVKSGDTIEAGDPLTDGPENPAMYVEHKGIGEARKRFIDAFSRASQDAGFRPHRRNLELLARGFIDNVELTKEHGDHVPGDVVSYTELAHDYEPRPGHVRVAPDKAVGKYLERPALHYSIGTMIRPSVVRDLEGAGINSIPVHADPPPFTPVAIRSHDKISYDPDPLTRMMGSNLEKGLLKGVHLGHVASTSGTSFVTPLAEGTSFNASNTKTHGWELPKKTAGDSELSEDDED